MVGVGQRCVVRVRIADIELRNARGIKATIVSPQGEEKCQDVSFDELESVAYVSTAVDSVGSWSMWLGVRFEEEAIYTPAFVFAEVDGEAKPCDAPYVVDVDVAGESVTVTPPHIDVDGGGDVSREEFDALAKDVADLAEQSKEFMPATPSGDPMHYAYVAIGAKWNANTGYWEFYDMKDITNIEMSRALARGSWYAGPNTLGPLAAFNPQSLNAIRFNFARTGAWGVTQDMDYFAKTNSYIEFVNMTHDNNLVAMPFTYVTYLNESFDGCSNLRRIYGELELSKVNGVRDAFKGCAKLESVLLYALKDFISFADSPLLSKESLLYMINNCASDVSFTITLHPEVYDNAIDSWSTEIGDAIDFASSYKGTTITLASA
jgi:hypothetical protein